MSEKVPMQFICHYELQYEAPDFYERYLVRVLAHHLSCTCVALAWQAVCVLLIAGNVKLTFSFFPQTKFFIRYENFVVVPDSTCLNFQVHITG